MNTQAEQAIQEILNSLQVYTQSVQGYNEVAYSTANDWAEQRQAYEYWVNANNSYVKYIADVSALTQTLTSEVRVPVPALSVVGIGILGLGVIYINTGAGALTGTSQHPFYETDDAEFNSTGYAMCVGGLPEGTIIYTSIATYSIHNGQLVNLMV